VLATYTAKRHFGVTPEPHPGEMRASRKRAAALEFVVQKHDATRLHFDVRIEIAGAMMSWAVPKGPSFDPTVKRLAVETEDHPMAYNRFEGRIPDGEYGAGDVLIWDRGTYETVPSGQEDAMRAKGHLHVRFFGEKLVGEWHFVRTRRGGAPREGQRSQWLMFKAKDEYADATRDIVAERPGSVVSGKSATRGPRRRGASDAGKSAATLLRTIGSPMRAVLARAVSDPKSFLYEIKFDGYRLLAARAGSEVRLASRKGLDWTSRFREVAAAVGALPVCEAVIDGEVCILDDAGRSSFGMLQAWLSGQSAAYVGGTLAFVAFDLLWVDGRDLRSTPLEQRRELLDALLKDAKAPLVFSRSLDGAPAKIEDMARRGGFEGLIAKRKGSPYVSGGAGGWWKLKFRREQEVAIAGYVPRSDANDEVGALLIAVATGKGTFDLAGKVGTGFDRSTRKRLAKLLDRDASDEPTVVGHPRVKGARWSKVKWVAQISLTEWTRDGSARAPSFIAIREDKDPGECVREKEAPMAATEEEARGMAPATHAARSASAKTRGARRTSEVKLTNPDKVLFPRDGITKAEITEYYREISTVMLPHLAGRPIGLQRWPNGIDGDAWFQQHAPEKVPDFVKVIELGPGHKATRKILVENVETLAWLSNLAALTIHQWASHVPAGTLAGDAVEAALEQADYAVLDLDPGNGTWADLIRVAEALRGLLERLELESVVKTSGQRGLHVLVPFARGPSHSDATELARKLATTLAAALPEIATVERMKAKRGGRLYVDFLQNGSGKTIVAPYTIRASDGAPVSMPIAWSEVTEKLDPRQFTVRTAMDRVTKHGDLLARAIDSGQRFPAVR